MNASWRMHIDEVPFRRERRNGTSRAGGLGRWKGKIRHRVVRGGGRGLVPGRRGRVHAYHGNERKRNGWIRQAYASSQVAEKSVGVSPRHSAREINYRASRASASVASVGRCSINYSRLEMPRWRGGRRRCWKIDSAESFRIQI